jgi:hypothetical protein
MFSDLKIQLDCSANFRRSRGNETLPLPNYVGAIGGQISKFFDLSVRPENLDEIQPFMATQSEVKSKIVLRQVTASTQNLVDLDEVSGRRSHSRIQSEAIALHAFQLEADPVIGRAA